MSEKAQLSQCKRKKRKLQYNFILNATSNQIPRAIPPNSFSIISWYCQGGIAALQHVAPVGVHLQGLHGFSAGVSTSSCYINLQFKIVYLYYQSVIWQLFIQKLITISLILGIFFIFINKWSVIKKIWMKKAALYTIDFFLLNTVLEVEVPVKSYLVR
jgi:hypothetical protein